MIAVLPLFGIVLVHRMASVAGRTWRDIPLYHSLTPIDPYKNSYLVREDAWYANTLEPTAAPSVSAAPSPSPTISRPPSQIPSLTPSVAPSNAPTVPVDPYPPNMPPSQPDPWYFNYNTTKGARFGPGFPTLSQSGSDIVINYENNFWGAVENPPYPYNTWLEFTDNGWGPWKGVLENRDPLANQCAKVGLQSPIDLVDSGDPCEETHQVRSRPGDFRIGGNSVLKLIEPNKLRLKYQRRNCADMTNPDCMEPDPPMADYPHGWSGDADVMHVDFKVPSEHLINGERFDAEMQIFNLHTERRRMPTKAALIRATEMGYNYYFEAALQVFEQQYNYDLSVCNAKHRRERQLVSQVHSVLGQNVSSRFVDYETWGDVSVELDRLDEQQVLRDIERSLQIGVWDPYHVKLVPTIYFWRYDGSLTEPPCGEFVSWFVCDVPMVISTDQLERMKKVLFTHVDQDCNPTSVHFEHSVARPIQDRGGRPVSLCTPSDFGPDPPGIY